MNNITAKNIAAFFIQKGYQSDDPITHLKLQKLLYYAQGIYLAMRGEVLFEDDIRAWDHGPVVTSVYMEFPRGRGEVALYPNNDDLVDGLSDDVQDVLNYVFFVYGRYGAWQLRNMTHKEHPWAHNKGSSKVIQNDLIEEFFITEIKDIDNFAQRHSVDNDDFEYISDIGHILKNKNEDTVSEKEFWETLGV